MIYNKTIDVHRAVDIPRYDIVDSHLHFLDFTQDSDGFYPLTEAMDVSGVSEAVVFGMPMVKKWDSGIFVTFVNASECIMQVATL